jgi:hypothetical protein
MHPNKDHTVEVAADQGVQVEQEMVFLGELRGQIVVPGITCESVY